MDKSPYNIKIEKLTKNISESTTTSNTKTLSSVGPPQDFSNDFEHNHLNIDNYLIRRKKSQ